MPPVILYEDDRWSRFLPLVYLRGLFQLRCGIGELWQRVERLILAADPSAAVGLWCRPDLQDLVAEETQRNVNLSATEARGRPCACLLLSGRGFWSRLPDFDEGESSWVGTMGQDGEIACLWADAPLAASLSPPTMLDADSFQAATEGLPRRDVSHRLTLFNWPWEIVHDNPAAITADWREAQLRGAEQAPPGVHLLNPQAIHLGPGTRVKPCVVIDAGKGPVWIGANVTIQPHVSIQGPCYIGNDCLIQANSVIRDGSSIGPRCKVGGEVEGAIIHGFSNKQHDGFLGHSYLGEWVNIGAGCMNSDLKNTYGTVRVPINGEEVESHQQFVGLLMGDYAKAGINVAFPTGSVVGVCSNIVVPAPPKFTPSFTWHDATGPQPFDVERCLVRPVK